MTQLIVIIFYIYYINKIKYKLIWGGKFDIHSFIHLRNWRPFFKFIIVNTFHFYFF
jgi:hypothetical protein